MKVSEHYEAIPEMYSEELAKAETRFGGLGLRIQILLTH